MQELSMNVLDIAQNSVRANATVIEISLLQNTVQQRQIVSIKDNGVGMSQEMVQNVTNPFYTTRTTRKVGLGIPFLKMDAELTGGKLTIESELGKGTTVVAQFGLNHIDLAPIGDMGSTIATLVQCNPEIDFNYTFAKNDASFTFSTMQVREIMQDVPLSTPSVAIFIRDYINENTQEILG